jgi:hypothetical protein
MDVWDLLPGLDSVAAFAFAIVSVMKPRADLVLENLALRQQIAVLKRKQTRPRIERLRSTLLVVFRRLWSGWAHVLALVEPAIVVCWHRLGFRLFWRRKSQKRAGGRSAISREIRELIRRMASENATWGAPRIHAELLKLGFKVSQRTVSRFMPKRPAPPDVLKRWIALLRNHADEIAAMDFFVVPTATFRVLYVWFAIQHGRRELALCGDRTSARGVGRAADSRRLPIRLRPTTPHLRWRPVLWLRGPADDSQSRHEAEADRTSMSLAERCGRALGGFVPSGIDRPRRAVERSSFAAPVKIVRRVLQRRSMPFVPG